MTKLTEVLCAAGNIICSHEKCVTEHLQALNGQIRCFYAVLSYLHDSQKKPVCGHAVKPEDDYVLGGPGESTAGVPL